MKLTLNPYNFIERFHKSMRLNEYFHRVDKGHQVLLDLLDQGGFQGHQEHQEEMGMMVHQVKGVLLDLLEVLVYQDYQDLRAPLELKE